MFSLLLLRSPFSLHMVPRVGSHCAPYRTPSCDRLPFHSTSPQSREPLCSLPGSFLRQRVPFHSTSPQSREPLCSLPSAFLRQSLFLFHFAPRVGSHCAPYRAPLLQQVLSSVLEFPLRPGVGRHCAPYRTPFCDRVPFHSSSPQSGEPPCSLPGRPSAASN